MAIPPLLAEGARTVRCGNTSAISGGCTDEFGFRMFVMSRRFEAVENHDPQEKIKC